MSQVRMTLVAIALGAAAAGAIGAPATPAPARMSAAAPPRTAVAAPRLASLSVTEIVARHVAARGGAKAWGDVRTLQFIGKIDAGRGDNVARAQKLVEADRRGSGKASNAEVAAAAATGEVAKQIQLPFTLDLKRPNLTRMEVQFDGNTAVQV